MLMQEEVTAAFHPANQCIVSFAARSLWLIPAVPIVASGVIALLKQPRRKMAAGLAIGSLSFSLLLVADGLCARRGRMAAVTSQCARR